MTINKLMEILDEIRESHGGNIPITINTAVGDIEPMEANRVAVKTVDFEPCKYHMKRAVVIW